MARLVIVRIQNRRFFWTRLFTCLLACAAVLNMPHQTFGLPRGRGVFETITVADGLSTNWINALVQDNDGLIWIGTRNGVNVYDGYSIDTYVSIPGDPKTLSSNSISSLFSDSMDYVWAGTNRGLNRIDPYTREITRFSEVIGDSSTLSGNQINTICEDPSGYLWIGTERGLNRYDPETETFSLYVNGIGTADERTLNNIRTLFIDDSGRFWIGSQHTLSLFDPASTTFTDIPLTMAAGDTSINEPVLGILPFDTDRLLVTYEFMGAVVFNMVTRRFEPFLLFDTAIERFEILQFMGSYLDSSGTYWFGTYQGLLRVNRDEGWALIYDEKDVPFSISSRLISSFLEDNTGILWFGTWSGVAKLNPSWERFSHFTGTPVSPVQLSYTDVYAIDEDLDGNIWVGTMQGLNRVDFETGKVMVYDRPESPPLASDRITLVESDSAGNIWVASRYSTEYKLTRIDPDGNVSAVFANDSIDDRGEYVDFITSFAEDSQGFLWFGCGPSGLNRYDPSNDTFRNYQNPNIQGQSVSIMPSAIAEDMDGHLWIATNTGLYRLDQSRENWTHYLYDVDDILSISSDGASALCVASDGQLWIGTDNGLNLFDPDTETFTSYLEDDGIASSAINHVLEDSQGYLWISTSRGISRFDPQAEQFRNYNYNDGLRNVEFAFYGAHRSEKNNLMFFGGWNGLIAFTPEELTESTIIPPVAITSMRSLRDDTILERIIHTGSEIRLNYRDNFFTFELAVLDFAAPEENVFMYMLEGFDSEWVNNGTNRTATYTDVPPGNYTFHVRGANFNGVWNNIGTSISVVIVPPFWMTTWFRVLIVLSFVGMVVLWYVNKMHKINMHEQELNEKVSERTRELEKKNKALIVSEQRFKRMFEQSSTGFILADAAGKLIDINDAGVQIFGTEDTKTRVYPNIFMDPFLPLQKVDELTRGLPVRFEVAYDFDDERVKAVFKSKHAGIHTLDVVASPLGMTDQGTPSQYLFQIADTTEQKLLQEQLLIRERMDFLGNLSAGIAHDFNNLLVGIMGNLDLLRISTEALTEEQSEYLDSSLKACKRASGLIQDFQSLSTGPVTERGNIDLYQIVKDVFGILERTTDRLIEKRIAFAPERYIVNARPDQLHQVFMNLGMNAAAAIEDKGVAPGDAIVVDAEIVSSIPFEGREQAEYIHISFGDSGVGMSDDVKRRAFDPLFTTKARGVHKGQGLGLAMVYTIITRNHKGFIDIETAPGRGTIIHMYLPKGMLADNTVLPPVEQVPTGNETVLIVEDEPSVRKVTQAFLETQGYQVLTAVDGREGLDTYSKRWEGIDLVLLDLTMPRLSGEVACSRMLEINPDARIIISSGHGADVRRHIDNVAGFLGKPYQMSELAQTVREVLDREQNTKKE